MGVVIIVVNPAPWKGRTSVERRTHSQVERRTGCVIVYNRELGPPAASPSVSRPQGRTNPFCRYIYNVCNNNLIHGILKVYIEVVNNVPTERKFKIQTRVPADCETVRIVVYSARIIG